MSRPIVLATRKSPLALRQTELAIAYLQQKLPHLEFEALPLSTTGDQQMSWSLQAEGGKGLFTKELEEALLDGRAHIAVHSAKDLPTELPNGLGIGGYLPRGIANDILVRREASTDILKVATGSPRRQAQLKKIFSKAFFIEIRGSVNTRLEKIAQGLADATVLAAAGLERLSIHKYPGLVFEELSIEKMVPAVGQAAIALEMQMNRFPEIRKVLCQKTFLEVTLERQFLKSLGGGCQVAYAAHVEGDCLHTFHEKTGYCPYPINDLNHFNLDSILKKIRHG